MKFTLMLIAVPVMLFACNDADDNTRHNAREAAAAAPKSPADSLYEVVDKKHIEGMAKMGKLRSRLGQVKQALDSIVKLPSGKIDENYQQSLIDLQEDLNYADFSMTTWMEEFKDTLKDNTQRIKYLQSENEKVTKVRDNILNGLQRADSLLKK